MNLRLAHASSRRRSGRCAASRARGGEPASTCCAGRPQHARAWACVFTHNWQRAAHGAEFMNCSGCGLQDQQMPAARAAPRAVRDGGPAAAWQRALRRAPFRRHPPRAAAQRPAVSCLTQLCARLARSIPRAAQAAHRARLFRRVRYAGHVAWRALVSVHPTATCVLVRPSTPTRRAQRNSPVACSRIFSKIATLRQPALPSSTRLPALSHFACICETCFTNEQIAP